MGLYMRRRPIARLATGAAVGGLAYHAGKARAEQDVVNEQATAAYQATQPTGSPYAPPSAYAPPPEYPPAPQYVPPPPAAPAAPSGGDSVAELQKLVQLHEAGALTDEEFASAKAKVLGL